MMPATDFGLETTELRRLQRRVERLFSALEEALEIESTDSFNSFSPTIDLCESENEVVVTVELPGVLAGDLELRVTAKDICIKGEKKHPRCPEKAISHFCCERLYGLFQRRINLRWAININKTTAELKDGMLLIHMPKLTDRRGKSVKIPIKVEE